MPSRSFCLQMKRDVEHVVQQSPEKNWVAAGARILEGGTGAEVIFDSCGQTYGRLTKQLLGARQARRCMRACFLLSLLDQTLKF